MTVDGISQGPDEELADTLDNLDGASNYAEWIFSFVRPYLGRSILEVGAGHGTFTEKLAQAGERVVAVDVAERCAGRLTERFAGDSRVSVFHGGIEAAKGSGPFDTAVLINVLEHIDDDDAALGDLRALLEPGGRLLIWVPAFQLLYSDFDRRIGHHRRYRREALCRQLARAGFDVAECRYVNTVGALAWLILARILGRTPTAAGPVSVYDRWFVPFLRRFEQAVPVPVGQSVFAAALRP